MSHVDADVLEDNIEWLSQEYKSIFEDGSGAMTVNCGDVHEYLGMKLDFSIPGKVVVSQFDYVQEIIDAFEEAEPNIKANKATAAPEDLFKVDEDATKLEPDKAETFHSLVAKTLFATKRARPDTCTAVAFLSTRVKAPDADDWRKLVHLMTYLRGTAKLPLILSGDGSGILKWYIDAAYAVHPNMRGHTGSGMSMGTGFSLVSSTKQKLNTRSSTECELVGVDDCMPMICWTRYFLDAQGYGVTETVVFQDNKSAILLENNGTLSSGKRTKHINIRYFFISDRVKNGELKVVWCPTLDMVGDYATKPLQGKLFRKFRDLLMGRLSLKEFKDQNEKKSGTK